MEQTTVNPEPPSSQLTVALARICAECEASPAGVAGDPEAAVARFNSAW